jgi:uncharacterized membrane protein YqiK
MADLIFKLWWVLPVVAALVMYKFGLRVFFGMIIVPDDRIGLVVKKFALYGNDQRLPDGRIIATRGEAGMQAKPLAPGLYWRMWPWQFSVTMEPFTIIEQNKLGLIKAKDGAPLDTGRVLGKPVECDKFQDAQRFLENAGH